MTLDQYLKFITNFLAFYCCTYTFVMIVFKPKISSKTIKKIKKIFFSFWLFPFSYYVYIILNMPSIRPYIVGNILARLLLHISIMMFAYRATLHIDQEKFEQK